MGPTIEQFFSQFHPQHFEKGEIILHPDENPIGALYLKKGHIRQYGISPEGTEITIHIFNPGTFFPMTWVLSDIANRYYYEALTDVDMVSAPKTKVIEFLKQEHEILFDLAKRSFMGLDKLSSRIEYLAYGKAYTKVVSILLYLARHFGEQKGNLVTFTQAFTHREIAALAGMSRETASREWEKLEKKKIIRYDKKTIVIEDIDKLKQELLSG